MYAAKRGWALPDGSFPIRNEKELHDAISDLGRTTKPKSTVVAHILKRARALGFVAKLGDGERAALGLSKGKQS